MEQPVLVLMPFLNNVAIGTDMFHNAVEWMSAECGTDLMAT